MRWMIPPTKLISSRRHSYASGLYQCRPGYSCQPIPSPSARTRAQRPQDYAAYVMKRFWISMMTPIIDSKPSLRGRQTVTVEDGEWLELFGTIATPTE